MRVVNEGAPSVRILSPADGARVPAGREIAVLAEGRDASRLWMAVNGARLWATAGDRLAGGWAPPPGTHTIVAVAEREGAPDGVDSVTITAVEDPGGPAPAPADAGGADLGGAAPGAPRPADGFRPGSGAGPGAPDADPPARVPAPAAPRTGRPGGDPAPAAAGGVVSPGGPGVLLRRPGAATTGRPRGGGPSPWARLIAGDLEMVARAAALPLLLLLAAGAYALLQRFIDGGAKLAWRGRGRPDDVVVEF